MSRKLLALILLVLLLFSNTGIEAQSDPVVKRFEVTAPRGYNPGYFLSWSPDGTLIAMCFKLDESHRLFETRWQVYDVETGELVNEFGDLIAWSADSSRVIVRRAPNTPLQILDSHTGTQLGTLEEASSVYLEDRDRVLPPFVMYNDVFSSIDSSTHVLLFHDTRNGDLIQTLPGIFGLPDYTHDGTRFAVNTETSVQIYDAKDYTLLYSLDGFAIISTYQSPWSPDDHHLLVNPRNAVRKLGPLHSWTPGGDLPGGDLSAPIYNVTNAAAWSPDSSILAAPTDYSKIRLYDSESGELLNTIRGFSEGGIHIEQWEENYLYAISGTYNSTGLALNIWDSETQTFLYQDFIDIGASYNLRGNILEVYEPVSRRLRQIDIATGEIVQQVETDQILWYRSPDGRWGIGTGSPSNDDSPIPLYVYQMEPFELVAMLQGHVDIVGYLAWSPDSHYFASTGESNVIVWEMSQ